MCYNSPIKKGNIMELLEQGRTLIEDFNMSDDYRILRILAGIQTSNEEKKFLIDNCGERISRMETDILLQTLRCAAPSFFTTCTDFIKKTIFTLNTRQIEALLYCNKHYNEVSNIADFLVGEEWFNSQSENKIFILGYELNKLLKEDCIDKETTIEMGIRIINTLTVLNTNPELFDMIMKNYISLLEKHNKEFIEQFKIYGYEIMDKHLEEGKELTSNLLIFDCEIMRHNNQSNVRYFEFYDSTDKDDGDLIACARAGRVRINVDSLKNVYAEQKNKMIATQWILKVIGHEIDHVFCELYQVGEERDLYTELKVYNSCIAETLQSLVNRDYYLYWHDNFTHEYQANIAGIKSVYERYKYLKSIKLEDKFEINRLFAILLRSSFCEIERDSKKGYFNAIEFTRYEFERYKDDLPKYVYHHLFNGQVKMPIELQELESNLTEYEKFMLGYHNIYMGIIDLIAKGEIKTANIFEELDTLYEKYKDCIKESFPPFIKSENDTKKIY